MAKSGYTGLERIIKASGYSLQGIRAAWKHESAFRQEVLLALVFLPLAICLGQNAVQISLLIGVLFLVLIVELLNSSIEAVVDRIGDEPHRLSGRAKDMSSAAVFLSLLLAIVVWSMIAVERFFPDFAPF
jgi:diacylglycerol kinase (ATP)